jgi:hypothetical protein
MVNPDVSSLSAALAGMAGISITVTTASASNTRPVTSKHFFIFLRILSPYP